MGQTTNLNWLAGFQPSTVSPTKNSLENNILTDPSPTVSYGGGNSNIFGIFTPKIGEMIQIDFKRIFFKWVGEKPPTSFSVWEFLSNWWEVGVCLGKVRGPGNAPNFLRSKRLRFVSHKKVPHEKHHGRKQGVFSRWWFQQICLEFSPRKLGKWSNLTSIFFRWVEATNQFCWFLFQAFTFIAIDMNDADGPTSLFKGCVIDLTILWKPLCPSRTYTWYKIDPNRTNFAVLNWWCVPLKAVKQTIRSPSEQRKLPNSAAGHWQMTFTVSHIFCSGLIMSQAMWLAWSVRHGPHMNAKSKTTSCRCDDGTIRWFYFKKTGL